MPLQIWFWVLMFVWLLFGLWWEYTPGQPYPYGRAGWNLMIFVLFGILGWQVFGAPVK